eukprot:6181585-Pleurochrysis_carterae.AAC.2
MESTEWQPSNACTAGRVLPPCILRKNDSRGFFPRVGCNRPLTGKLRYGTVLRPCERNAKRHVELTSTTHCSSADGGVACSKCENANRACADRPRRIKPGPPQLRILREKCASEDQRRAMLWAQGASRLPILSRKCTSVLKDALLHGRKELPTLPCSHL